MSAPLRADTVAASPAQEQRSVCIIVENQSFGGMEVHTLGLMQALIERGYAIELVSNRYRGYDAPVEARDWQQHVRIVHTDLDGILYGPDPHELQWRDVLAKVSSRTLIFPRGDWNYGQPGFLRSCRRKFDRIVYIEHLEATPRPTSTRRWLGIFPGLSLWWHRRRVLSRRGSRNADCIVAVSRAVRNRLVNEIGVAGDKVVVVHNGVPWQKFRRDEARGVAFRTRWSVPADAFVFGMLGRLNEQKGIDIALRALAALVRRDSATRAFLVVAGEGALLDRLADLARQLAVVDRVRFIGFVSEPAEVLSGYDVILFSSRNEGLPLGLLEGMANGCIPIVTRISGMPEVVTSEEIGRIVAPEAPEELATAMADILALDAVALSRMRHDAVEKVRRDFDLAESQRKILQNCGL